MFLFGLFPLLILISLVSFPCFASEIPPNKEAADLKANLALNPDDAVSWIRLGDLQRLMGYGHEARESFKQAAAAINKLEEKEGRAIAGAYYLARAWLEYDATDWTMAVAMGKKAIKFESSHESRLVTLLALAAAPDAGDDDDPSMYSLLPINESGPQNRRRNFYWIVLMRHHFWRLEFNEFSFSHTGGFRPKYNWAELFCRRDHGYVFESKGSWKRAEQFYEFSVERSEVSRGNWAVRHHRQTPLQAATDPPMPFWTNVDGGYVTGSLMAYTGYACEQMLRSGHHEERERWAVHLGDGASRCLAVYPTHPWPWLWRSLAWQVQNDLKRAKSDLRQAEVEFAEINTEDPAYAYAKGHELILEENYAGALPWLEKAVNDLTDWAGVWSDLGLTRVMCRDRDGALEAFDRTLDLAPDCTAALHNRGLMHLQDGRIDAALVDLSRAAELAPEDQQVVTDLQRARLAVK